MKDVPAEDFRKIMFDMWGSKKFPIFPVFGIVDGQCTCGSPNCTKPGKHPCIKRYSEEALRFLDEPKKMMRKWAKEFPNHNLAMCTGSLSGLCVLDVDFKNGVNGYETLKKILTPEEIDTMSMKSGGKGIGKHLYYAIPPGRTIINRVNFQPGLDLRGDGGLIVVPGSMHIDGNFYEIDNWITPLFCPKIILDEGNPDRYTRSKDKGGIDWTGVIQEGQGRNTFISRAYGKLIGTATQSGLDMLRGDARSLIGAMNEKNCNPPLEAEELVTILDSIENREEGQREKQEEKIEKETEQFRIKVLSVGKFCDRFAKEDSWLIEDWLPMGGIMLQVGLPGAYKSWLNMAMAWAISSGEPFLGRYPVLKKGKVLLLQLEDNHADVAHRLEYFRSGGKEVYMDGEVNYGKLKANENLLTAYTRDLNFTSAESKEFIYELLNYYKPELVIIDPLYKTVSMDDFMVKASQELGVLKVWRDKFECTFVLSHHMNKSGSAGKIDGRIRDGAYGSTIFLAFQEQGIQQLPFDGYPGCVRVHRNTKSGKPLNYLDMRFDVNDETEKFDMILRKDDNKAFWPTETEEKERVKEARLTEKQNVGQKLEKEAE